MRANTTLSPIVTSTLSSPLARLWSDLDRARGVRSALAVAPTLVSATDPSVRARHVTPELGTRESPQPVRVRYAFD